MHIPLENLIPSHANCMQHVLRCWEMQSDGSDYKKTLRRPGLRPGPPEGAYSAPANPLVGEEGLAVPSPRTPPPLSVLRPRIFYPHSKISSDAVDHGQLVGPQNSGAQMKSGGGEGAKKKFPALRAGICAPPTYNLLPTPLDSVSVNSAI